jgi:arsenite methyltransferase
MSTVDAKDLEAKVKEMYREVAENPRGEFHFEMGRAMAERLGYSPADLDLVPPPAIESFAGVGHFFHLADLKPGETALDLGARRRKNHPAVWAPREQSVTAIRTLAPAGY